MFITPMYACPLPNSRKNPKEKPFILVPGKYVANEKYDGIRLITEISNISDKLFVTKGITSWSRYGNIHPCPEHIQEELAKFPNCILDGELLAPGKRSYGTLTIANSSELVYFIFDLLQLSTDDGRIIDTTHLPYLEREKILRQINPWSNPHVCLAPSTSVDTWEEIYALRDEVYARDGEGLILKRMDAPYTIGKRPKNTWIKIKKLESAPFTVIGFEASRGEKNYRGPFGMTRLRDRDGIITQVKTKNDAQCRLFEERAKQIPHPDIGRTLWCEFQERTPDASYRHIRWDHWDEE